MRFSLSTVLVITTLFGIGFGWFLNRTGSTERPFKHTYFFRFFTSERISSGVRDHTLKIKVEENGMTKVAEIDLTQDKVDQPLTAASIRSIAASLFEDFSNDLEAYGAPTTLQGKPEGPWTISYQYNWTGGKLEAAAARTKQGRPVLRLILQEHALK